MQIVYKIYKGHNSNITSKPCNQLTLRNFQVKEKCPVDCKYKLWTQFITLMSLHQSHEKSTLILQKENVGAGIITIKKTHSTKNDIQKRQHFNLCVGT